MGYMISPLHVNASCSSSVTLPPLRRYRIHSETRFYNRPLRYHYQVSFGLKRVATTPPSVRRCSESWGHVEEEVLRFMESSDCPHKFPSKTELLDAGRDDLVNSIISHGGWLSAGWDLEETQNQESGIDDTKYLKVDLVDTQCQIADTQRGGFSDTQFTKGNIQYIKGDTQYQEGVFDDTQSGRGDNHIGHRLGDTHGYVDSSSMAEYGVYERRAKDDVAIAIRSSSHLPLEMPIDISPVEVCETSASSENEESGLSGILSRVGKERSKLLKEATTGGLKSKVERKDEEDAHHVQTWIMPVTSDAEPDSERTFDDIKRASDASEFQETEIMKLRSKLRSTRAKLLALEGKMTMEIKELRNVIEEKQKVLGNAEKLLSVMRIARIVWPSSASEVLVAGSFDGWTSQRQMERSNAGVFVVSLLLYPGRYEIKFIVDGVWKVDPQRPVVYSNGYENNLLIVN